jgi:hypothetical protein
VPPPVTRMRWPFISCLSNIVVSSVLSGCEAL